MADKEPHVLVRDWLLEMGYPKSKFPANEELQKVCRGSIYRCFWKNVIKNVKPKEEIQFIRKNIFVDSIRRYENIEESSKVKLGQVLPPEPLLLWKKCHDKETELRKLKKQLEKTENCLKDKLLKLKMKSYSVEQLRKTLCDRRREVHLMNETIRQLNEDIKQSKFLIDIMYTVPCVKNKLKSFDVDENKDIDFLADFLSAATIKSPDSQDKKSDNESLKDPLDALFSIKENESPINVESLMEHVNVSQVYAKLLHRRENMIENILNDNKIEEELKEVVDRARAAGVFPWKENLTLLNLLHCNVAIVVLHNKKCLNSLVAKFKQLLVDKLRKEELPDSLIEIIKLKCKYVDLNAQITTFKELQSELSNGSDLFPKNDQSENSLGEAILNTRDNIMTMHSMYNAKQITLQENVNKLTESVAFMKDLRKSFYDAIGHSEINSNDRNESLNFSFLCANSTFKSSINKNTRSVIDIKHTFFEPNTVEQVKKDLDDVCKLQIKEIKMLSDFNLSRNRKIVLDNGAKFWCDDALHTFQYFELNDQYTLFKFINPFKLTTGIAEDLCNMLKWKKSLEDMSVTIRNKKPKVYPFKDKPKFSLDENSDPKMDLIFKNGKKCSTSLKVIHDTINSINKKILFFKNTDFKMYISSDRRFEGQTYYELEDEIKTILAEEAYWKQQNV